MNTLDNLPSVITGNPTEKLTNLDSPISSAINAVIDFYTAFNQQDMVLMTQNWVNSDDAILCNPLGGFLVDWENIKPLYQNLFASDASVYVEYYDFSLFMDDSQFVIAGKERGHFSLGEKHIELAIRTTRTYKRLLEENDTWQQIHHHGSIDNPELLKDYQDTVFQK